MKKMILFCLLLIAIINPMKAQKIKLNFTGNLIDSSVNNYQIDTNLCGNALTFCDDPSGAPNSAYEFNGICSMRTDSFSMTSTNYPGQMVSFYMNKNFDSDTIQYGILHFYKGSFLIFAHHDSLFVTVTDSSNLNHTYGVPYNFPNDEWVCVVVSFRDYGDVDFYLNKVKYNAGTTNYKIVRRKCEPGGCYFLTIAPSIWDYHSFKGKLDDIRVWEFPSDSIHPSEICNKNIVPLSIIEQVKHTVQYFPNPFDQKLNIECNEKGEVCIMDISGRFIFKKSFDKGVYSIDTHLFPNGSYFLLFKNSTTVYSLKLLKQ